MVDLGAGPTAGVVTRLAAARHGTVGRAGRFTGQTIGSTQMAGRTLIGDRHVGVERTRIPRSKSGFVAGVAVGYRNRCQALIRDVITRSTIGWRKGA